MAWYYVLNGASLGPVAESEIQSLRSQNVVSADTPVWTEGMAEWVPFQQSKLSAAPSMGGLAVKHSCIECGRSFPEEEMLNYEGSWVCAACKPIFFQRIKEGVAPKGSLIYASVGRRFAAVLVDGVILLVVIFIPLMVLMMFFVMAGVKSGNTSENPMPVWLMPIIMLLEYGLPAAFEIFFIGKYGATPGKMLLKVKVVSPDGGPISYGRATGRYFSKILSGIILYIGFLMAFWDEEKRALHDRICQTRVISTE